MHGKQKFEFSSTDFEHCGYFQSGLLVFMNIKLGESSGAQLQILSWSLSSRSTEQRLCTSVLLCTEMGELQFPL
jgi:hypothetical protein